MSGGVGGVRRAKAAVPYPDSRLRDEGRADLPRAVTRCRAAIAVPRGGRSDRIFLAMASRGEERCGEGRYGSARRWRATVAAVPAWLLAVLAGGLALAAAPGPAAAASLGDSPPTLTPDPVRSIRQDLVHRARSCAKASGIGGDVARSTSALMRTSVPAQRRKSRALPGSATGAWPWSVSRSAAVR